jgi:hypothetical protein
MKRKQADLLVREIWIVGHESEGLIVEAFTRHKPAAARAKALARKHPSARTEIAKYLIALNSRKSFATEVEEEEE